MFSFAIELVRTRFRFGVLSRVLGEHEEAAARGTAHLERVSRVSQHGNTVPSQQSSLHPQRTSETPRGFFAGDAGDRAAAVLAGALEFASSLASLHLHPSESRFFHFRTHFIAAVFAVASFAARSAAHHAVFVKFCASFAAGRTVCFSHHAHFDSSAHHQTIRTHFAPTPVHVLAALDSGAAENEISAVAERCVGV